MRIFCIGFAMCLMAYGCDNPDAKTPPEPDNTKINERDAGGNTKTAFDQSNEQADLDLAAQIRKDVLAIDDLSTSGQNIKIITNRGKVVLRGPVATAEERDAIVKVANGIAGESKVTNQLEVAKD